MRMDSRSNTTRVFHDRGTSMRARGTTSEPCRLKVLFAHEQPPAQEMDGGVESSSGVHSDHSTSTDLGASLAADGS